MASPPKIAFLQLPVSVLAAALCQLLASLPIAENLIFMRILAVENPTLRAIARPYLKALPDSPPGETGEASVGRQLRFTLPLSLGSVLMTATAFITTYFYSYSSDPERFRLIHYVTYGLAVAFFASALKFQTVAVVFAKGRAAARRPMA